jgi:glyoxylase-like metal-dependent hydrolase (beta-lactamase superfamily II)
MRIHHLNCGTMCPLGGWLIDGLPGVFRPGHLVCHCLLIESEHGLVLVDTGFGMCDVEVPVPRLSPLMVEAMRIRLDARQTAIYQLRQLGFSPLDVRHIVLTHLDFDHAGGLDDFPRAEVHVFAPEAVVAEERPGAIARRRYRPMQWHWRSRWREYKVDGDPWFGFAAVRDLVGLPPEILLVPLAGHTIGHCGVAVQEPEGWLLHAGDAYFFREEMNPDRPWCTPGLRGYQRLMEMDRAARLRNQSRLRRLVREHGAAVRVFCAHDPVELAAWQRARVRGAGPGLDQAALPAAAYHPAK